MNGECESSRKYLDVKKVYFCRERTPEPLSRRTSKRIPKIFKLSNLPILEIFAERKKKNETKEIFNCFTLSKIITNTYEFILRWLKQWNITWLKIAHNKHSARLINGHRIKCVCNLNYGFFEFSTDQPNAMEWNVNCMIRTYRHRENMDTFLHEKYA